MTDWKIHFIFGNFLSIIFIFLFFSFGYKLSYAELFFIVAIIQFTSVFPDIDLKKSKIRNFTSVIIAICGAGFYMFFFQKTWFYGPIYFLILYVLLKSIPTKHRGLIHTFKFSLIYSIFFAFLLNFTLLQLKISFLIWFIIIFSSYNLHLVLDKLE